MKEYAVKTRFIFKGHFFVKAKNKKEAKEFAENHCELVLKRGIHSTLSDEKIDWDFPVHPEKSIGKVKVMDKTIYKGFPI